MCNSRQQSKNNNTKTTKKPELQKDISLVFGSIGEKSFRDEVSTPPSVSLPPTDPLLSSKVHTQSTLCYSSTLVLRILFRLNYECLGFLPSPQHVYPPTVLPTSVVLRVGHSSFTLSLGQPNTERIPSTGK